jgi:hypothetical protein
LTGDVSEFFVLDVEEFAEKAACSADFACFVGGISAFGANEVNIFAHFYDLFLIFQIFRRMG